MSFSETFSRFAKWTAHASGRPATFALAFLVIAVWAVTGPLFHFSDTWQLVINTGTTIVTFLMVFLIQNTQNRDSTAMQIKLDELIRALQGAHNAVVSLEEAGDAELARVQEEYDELAQRARGSADDTGSPEVAKEAASAESKAADAKATAEEAKRTAGEARDEAKRAAGRPD
jgi:low affinity Fe/Cu permease